MIYQIDQSHKIEQTEKDTILALSNDVQFSVVLKAKDKRAIQREFRQRGEPRNFILFTFSLLLVYLLKQIEPGKRVVIDLEYKGSENIIHDRLIEYSRRFRINIDCLQISFRSVGKESPAHRYAARIATKKEKPNLIVEKKELIKILFPRKKIGHPKRT